MSLKTRLRSKFTCECGATILCKLRAVGQLRKCLVCSKEFEVPPPESPPSGPLWNVPFGLTRDEYKRYETELSEYSAAIQAKDRYPELFDHIMRTLVVIHDFQNQYSDYAGGEDVLGRFV
jgi:hypothetical protein